MDSVKIRSAIGGALFLLALFLVLPALLTDEWITSEVEEGSRTDLDSDWWHLRITMGAREANSNLEMFDPESPVVVEHYNYTTYVYQRDLEKGGQALQYSLISVILIVPVCLLLCILAFFRKVPGSVPTTFTAMILLLLIFGSFMFFSRARDMDISSFIPEDEMLISIMDDGDESRISANSTIGTSTYLTLAAMGALIPNSFLFIGMKREKRLKRSEISKGFFRRGTEDDVFEHGRERSGPAAVLELEDRTVKERSQHQASDDIRSGRL